MLQRYEESIAAYEQALVIRESSECHYNIATAYRDMDRLDEAATHYEKAIELDGANIDAKMFLGCVREKLGQSETAK